MSIGKFFKSVGHTVSKGSKSIGHVFKDAGHTIGKSVSTVYKDGKSAISYGGKHLIGDVDNLSSSLSSPILYIGLAAVGLLLLTRK